MILKNETVYLILKLNGPVTTEKKIVLVAERKLYLLPLLSE